MPYTKAMYTLTASMIGSVDKSRSGRDRFFSRSSRRSTSISSCLAWMPQLRVRRRSSVALLTRITGGYVSSRRNISSASCVLVVSQLLLAKSFVEMRRTPRKPMIVVMYSVQRQPRYDMLMKPPMNGASKGLQDCQSVGYTFRSDLWHLTR